MNFPTPVQHSSDVNRTVPLGFRGGAAGALAPFLVFIGGVSWLGISGAPDETGFGPILIASLGAGILLARKPSQYAEAVIEGMSHRIVMMLILAWLLAGIMGVVLRESGLIDALVWMASSTGVQGGGYVVATFVVCSIFSTATGTSLGTILVCAPLLYPTAGLMGADGAFTIGAVLAGATFGDNISPISDTTIASATTQGADLGGVVRSRMRYALPAGAAAVIVFALFGGASGAEVHLDPQGNPAGLIMLLVPAGVLTLLLRRTHLVVGLFAGIGSGILLGLVLGRFGLSELLVLDRENFIATGIILDGMRRAFGVSIFTILLMGLVGGLTASGLLERVIAWVTERATKRRDAEWWIFGSISGATLLTTHSAVAILTVGSLASQVGINANLDRYRRANILDVTVCTYPFLLPFFIPTILAASMTAGIDTMPTISPWTAGLHNAHSWSLLMVLVATIARGQRQRDQDETEVPPFLV